MNNRRFTLIALSLLLSLVCNTSFSQGSATVSGVIKDASTGSTLPGAAVILQGINKGTITDNYGKYILTGVPVGEQVLLFTYIGYKNQTFEVSIVAGQSQTVNIVLEVEAFGVEEVVITHQLLGQTKAINQQLRSDAIVNIVSEDKIKELPDVNAAEAIGRIPGISLLRSQGEGQKVVIRGMEPRFSAITINGVKVPSNDGTDKSVDLSMISPELLQGIEVYKSPTPDMDAESVGGTVNLLLNKAADDPKLELRAGSGYNALHNDFGDYNFAGTYNRRFFKSKLGVILQANTERINRGSESTGFDGEEAVVDSVDVIYPVAIKLIKDNEIRKRQGGSINLDYRLPKGGDISLFSFISSTDRNNVMHKGTYRYPENKAYLDAGRYVSNSTLFSNMLSGRHVLGIIKTDWSVSYAKTEGNTPTNYYMNFLSPTPYLGVEGLDDDDFSAWIDQSTITDDTVTYLQDFSSKTKDISESSLTGVLNFEIPFSIGNDISATVKFGGKYNQLDRETIHTEHRESLYDLGLNVVESWTGDYPYDHYIKDNRMLLKTFTDPGYSPEDFMKGDYTFNNPIDIELTDNWYDYFKDAVHNMPHRVVHKNLDLQETITAGYLMTKIKYKSLLTVIAGMRVEMSDNTYNSVVSSLAGSFGQFGEVRDTITYQKYTEYLPHLHLKFEPVKWYTLRLSAAKTLARPNYDYISYCATISDLYKNISTGNPDLKHMTSMNYDLSMSFYDGKYGLLTIGGFYKDMENIFYRSSGLFLHNDSIAEAAGWPGKKHYRVSTYTNSPEATAYGLEVDLQTSLKFLPAPFNGLVLSANFSRIFSKTTKHTNALITTDSLIFDPVLGPYFFQYSETYEREISNPGQVPFILNLSVGYDYKGFSCRISTNYQGGYLANAAAVSAVYDITRLGFWRWDFAMKQRITKNIEIYFNANNLNSMREQTYWNDALLRSDLLTGMILSYGLRFEF